MKRSILICGLLIMAFFAHANDVIQLDNGMLFKGKVKKFQNCELTFKANGSTYQIPASDITHVGFEKVDSRVAKKFYEMEANGYTLCDEGKADAKAFHGKAVKHVIGGILFGPIGTVMALIGNPSPRKGKQTRRLSENRDLFSNPQYLSCYKKEAKKNNVLYTLVGWVVIPAVIALASN